MSDISVVKSQIKRTHAGPSHRITLQFQCTPTCQYFHVTRVQNGNNIESTFKCRRQNRPIETVTKEHGSKVNFPNTPDWCAFTDFAYKESIESVANLLDDVERMSMLAIKLTKAPERDPNHSDNVLVKFNYVARVGTHFKIKSVVISVNPRMVVNDNRLLVHYVDQSPTYRTVLVELPESPNYNKNNVVSVPYDNLYNPPSMIV